MQNPAGSLAASFRPPVRVHQLSSGLFVDDARHFGNLAVFRKYNLMGIP